MIICSLNVRGLSNDKKRRETFLWLKKKQFSIYFLQEVHSTKKSGIYWRSECGYSTIFTEFSSSKAGVGILFNNNFQFKIQKCLTDPGGRFIIADIETEERTLTLVNIYAPNNDDPSFFRVVSEKMSSFECDLIVFGGDFNLVCDIQKDKKAVLLQRTGNQERKCYPLKKNSSLLISGESIIRTLCALHGKGQTLKFNAAWIIF